MSASKRLAFLGIAFGWGLALWCWLPQAQADSAGVPTMGSAEAMFVLSLPMSLATWIAWLIPASMLFGPGDGQIPRWVGYAWMLLTPPLNWGVVGWLVGKWWDRRTNARVNASPLDAGP